jgi:peptide/nickel transport system substrate-binding protein
VARGVALAAAVAVSLLAVSGAGGAGAQAPKRGGTVVVAMNSLAEPTCLGWDPVCLGRWQWLDKVLALPFRLGPDGVRNDLVGRHSLTKDPFTVTFHIRPEARWSDGVPISARDFAFAYRTYLDHWDLPDDDPFRTAIRRVDAVDAKTVRFVFRSQYGDWNRLLQFPPLPRHALRGVNLAASEDFWRDGIVDPRTGRAIGSGPFLVGRWERGKQLALVRNPRYWGRHKAYVERIVLRFVRGTTAEVEQALRSGDVDLGVVGAPPRDLQPHPGFDLHTTTWSNWEHFEFRVGPGGHPTLRDKRVRRALANGIDRVALARSLFGDVPVLDNTIFLTSERNYRPNWSRYRYRPATARGLLEQAGCRRGPDGVYVCAGERLRLRFFTTAGAPQRQRVLELVAAQLRRVGVEVQPVYVPNAVLFQTVLPGGDFDVALFSYGKAAPDEVFTPYRCGAGYNPSGYCSRLLTADVDQLDRIVDPARRTVVGNRVDRRLAADVPALPLYQIPLTYVVRKGLRGVVPNGYSVLTSGWSVWNAEAWWLER